MSLTGLEERETCSSSKLRFLINVSLVKGVQMHVIPLGSFSERFDMVFPVLWKQCSCFLAFQKRTQKIRICVSFCLVSDKFQMTEMLFFYAGSLT